MPSKRCAVQNQGITLSTLEETKLKKHRYNATVCYFKPYKISRYMLLDNLHYYIAESVFAMRLVNLRSVTCYTDQNFKENAHFRALNLLTSEKKSEIKLQDVYQP